MSTLWGYAILVLVIATLCFGVYAVYAMYTAGVVPEGPQFVWTMAAPLVALAIPAAMFGTTISFDFPFPVRSD